MKIIEKTKSWYRGLPDKKRYIEFFTAILTVPVLLTVIITNVNNLKSQSQKDNKDQTPSQTSSQPVVTIIERVVKDENNTAPTTTAAQLSECKKEVGPVEIVYPDEAEKVNKNPICIDISYRTGDYCAVVWSYRINGSSWSDYNDKSICLYNLDPGDKKLELKVKSIASGDEVILKRNFTVEQTVDIPTPTEATSSATQ
ncbi:hypothetical protein ACFL1A_03090 [Patescibacteria group bacterium]